jgi:hypothetical protein
MSDGGDSALGNVRINRELRRRRHVGRNRGARHRGQFRRHGNVGHYDGVGDINVVNNFGDVRNAGNLGIVRSAGHVGNVGNVRLRLKQRCCIVQSNVNDAHHSGRRRSNRNSVRII